MPACVQGLSRQPTSRQQRHCRFDSCFPSRPAARAKRAPRPGRRQWRQPRWRCLARGVHAKSQCCLAAVAIHHRYRCHQPSSSGRGDGWTWGDKEPKQGGAVWRHPPCSPRAGRRGPDDGRPIAHRQVSSPIATGCSDGPCPRYACPLAGSPLAAIAARHCGFIVEQMRSPAPSQLPCSHLARRWLPAQRERDGNDVRCPLGRFCASWLTMSRLLSGMSTGRSRTPAGPATCRTVRPRPAVALDMTRHIC